MASGSDATGNKDYVLFLYETLDIPSAEYPFVSIVLQICHVVGDTLTHIYRVDLSILMNWKSPVDI